MKQLSDWFHHNKVLLIGLVSAVALALNQAYDLATNNHPEPKVLVFAAFIAALGFCGKNLRGQWQSIAGILGTSFYAYMQQESMGYVNWGQIIFAAVVAYFGVISPPPKSRGYEHTDIIQAAKEQGEVIQPSAAPEPNPKPPQ